MGVGVGGSGVLAHHVEPSLTVATELAALYTGLWVLGVPNVKGGLADWRSTMAQTPWVPKAAKT